MPGRELHDNNKENKQTTQTNLGFILKAIAGAHFNHLDKGGQIAAKNRVEVWRGVPDKAYAAPGQELT